MKSARKLGMITLVSIFSVSLPMVSATAQEPVAMAAKLSPADKIERAKAEAQLRAAYEKANATPAYRAAATAKSAPTLTTLLIRNGAPADTTVTPGSGPKSMKITITCCSKKSWGPVSVSFGR